MGYRYIGNKTRLLHELKALVVERVAPGGLVADLMCGTASFAAGMRQAGFRVVASDIMTFAYLHARVRLTMGHPPAFERAGGYKRVLEELNALRPESGYFTREYSPAGEPHAGVPPRKYFSAENARQLDAISSQVETMRRDNALTGVEHELLRHDLVLAANRVANIAGTFGHYRSKWSESALVPLQLRPTEFVNGTSTNHDVRQGSAEQIANGLAADLCYLDPPYTKRQYAANYHLPETIARADEAPAVGVSGLRPWRDQYSDFCSKVRIRRAFQSVIEGMDCPRFLISYSEDGLLSKQELMTFLSEFGRVRCIELENQRFRSNESRLGRTLTEYVFDLERAVTRY